REETSMAEADRARWDARYWEHKDPEASPSPFLVGLDALLPRHGAALDVAGGSGRHALWLARRGLDVTLVDISVVALEIARNRADALHLRLHTIPVDLEAESLLAGPWDLVVCVDFLWRPMFHAIPGALAPGGYLVVAHPTKSNRQRHAHPGLRFLLDDG